MYGRSLFAALIGLGLLPGVAAASECADRASQLIVETKSGEQQMVDDKAKVVLDTTKGQKDVTGATDDAKPRDTWIGAPSNDDRAIDKLEAAIDADEKGKLDGCRQLLAEVETMLVKPGEPEKEPAKAKQ
jgi:hypothetical protein